MVPQYSTRPHYAIYKDNLIDDFQNHRESEATIS